MAATPQPKAADPPGLAHPRLEIGQHTDAGNVRSQNEDYVTHCVPSDPRQVGNKGVLCLVADGMGGHQAGEVASRQAVDVVVELYYGDRDLNPGRSLVRAFKGANHAIYELSRSDPAREGMGSTLVGAVILGDRVFVANVGDSRAYFMDADGIAQITEDHSWVEEQVRAGLLTADQARGHPRRNLVTRALGAGQTVDVDLFEGAMAPGDVLLLCTDGLSGHLHEREIEAIVRAHAPRTAAERLVDRAKKRGSTDNITVLVARAEPAGELPLKAGKRSRGRRLILVTAALLLLAAISLAAWLLSQGGVP